MQGEAVRTSEIHKVRNLYSKVLIEHEAFQLTRLIDTYAQITDHLRHNPFDVSVFSRITLKFQPADLVRLHERNIFRSAIVLQQKIDALVDRESATEDNDTLFGQWATDQLMNLKIQQHLLQM